MAQAPDHLRMHATSSRRPEDRSQPAERRTAEQLWPLQSIKLRMMRTMQQLQHSRALRAQHCAGTFPRHMHSWKAETGGAQAQGSQATKRLGPWRTTRHIQSSPAQGCSKLVTARTAAALQ